MTLHWWMHWFWITYQFTFCVFLTNSMPLSPASTTPPTLEILEHNRPLRRPIKSIDQITKSQVSISLPFPDTSDTSDITIGLSESLAQLYKTKTTLNPEKTLCLNNITVQKNATSEIKNETYYLCSSSSSSSKKAIKSNDNLTISTVEPPVDTTELSPDNLTTITTTTTTPSTTISGSDNFTSVITNNSNNTTLESVIVTKEIVSAKVSDAENISTSSNLTAVSITGISFGVLIFAAFIGVTSFVLYRRRYLNKPQTLNDKCSNPDSSGYIDDSTMRENSEEMYSLDNDSFLNSIEAMTIQNYWTDSVKHTKL